MLSYGSALLMVLGFAFAIAGAFARGYVRSRLREVGVTLTAWVTVLDDVRNAEQYFHLAKQKRVPAWPLLVAVVGLPGSFLLMAAAILLR
jgi:hypothetical protein